MVPVEGGRVYVRVNGDLAAQRAPIVMIHGGPGGTHAGFLEALPLANERAVILYDQLDTGRSDRPNNPSNWRVSRFVDALEAIRTALRVPRWHVLGASWGGTVALEYGARRPAALAGLALASPLVSTRSWLADASALIQDLPPAIRAELQRCGALTMAQPPAACDAPTRAFYAAFNRRLPAAPMAIPTVAAASAGASLIPSPTIATGPSSVSSERTTSTLSSGRRPAYTRSTPSFRPTTSAVS